MKLTSRQRAYLISLASSLDPVFQVGKTGVTPMVTAAVEECFHNRELIKIAVLKNCAEDPEEIAGILAERTHATAVKVIGRKIILYRPNKEKPKIELPRADRKDKD